MEVIKPCWSRLGWRKAFHFSDGIRCEVQRVQDCHDISADQSVTEGFMLGSKVVDQLARISVDAVLEVADLARTACEHFINNVILSS